MYCIKYPCLSYSLDLGRTRWPIHIYAFHICFLVGKSMNRHKVYMYTCVSR